MSNKALGWVWENSPYKGTKLVIHLAVADTVNDLHKNRFWASNETLANKANSTRTTVNEFLRELVDDGWLKVVNPATGRDRTVEYEFVFKSVPNEDTPDSGDVLNADTLEGESVPNEDTLFPESVLNADTNPSTTNPTTDTTQEEKALEANNVRLVWDAYLATLGRCGFSQNKVLDEKRRKLIKARLNEFPVETLILAVEGLEHSQYHRGNNESRTVYNKIELILRSAEKVEQFLGYHEKRPTKTDERKHVNDAWGRSDRTIRRGKVIAQDDDFMSEG